jgi:malonyl CoA-acyl carrier protein transacylase/phosphopantetheinyl transferase (holo-ACP synthase)
MSHASPCHVGSYAGGRLLLFSAGHIESLRAAVASFANSPDAASFAKCNATLPENAPLILAVVSSTPADRRAKVIRAGRLLGTSGRRRIQDRNGIYFESEPLAVAGRVAAMFPGGGSQYSGALDELTELLPEKLDVRRLKAYEDSELFEFGPAVNTMVTSDLALFDLLSRLGVRPGALVGHSAGEVAALIASRAIEADDAGSLTLLAADVDAMIASGVLERLPRAVLLAVGASDRKLALALAGVEPPLRPAMLNCPHQTVFAVAPEMQTGIIKRLESAGILYERLPFDRPYHSPGFADVADCITAIYDRWITKPPELPVYSCAIASQLASDVLELRSQAAGQWTSPVRFTETIEAMYEDGFRVFVEVGPNGNLCGFVGDILKGRPHVAVPLNLRTRSSREQLLHAAAQLIANGEPIPPCDLDWLVGGLEENNLDAVGEGHCVEAAASQISEASEPERRSPEIPRAIQSHLEYMTSFFAAQKSVMQAYLDRRRLFETSGMRDGVNAGGTEGHGATGVHAAQMPLITTVESQKAGMEISARCDLTLNDLILRHHTFSRDVSTLDSSLAGLPVVPLTLSIELMAEAAALLCPGSSLVSIANIRAHRWATTNGERVVLRVRAHRLDGERNSFSAAVYEDVPHPDGRPVTPVAEATYRFAAAYDAAPAAKIDPTLSPAGPFDRELLYRKYMFHGESFRGTVAVDRTSPTAISSQVEILPRHGLIASTPHPLFLVDPVELDQAGQLLWEWLFFCRGPSPKIFPVRIDEIEVFGPPLPEGAVTRAYLSDPRISGLELAADIDLCDPNGRVRLRARRWAARIFPVPEAFFDFMLAPGSVALSQPVDLLADWARELAVRQMSRTSYPDAFFLDHGQLWLRTLAWTVLTRREREMWLAITGTTERKLEWLLGRTVAKEAVRTYLLRHRGLSVNCADIEIFAAEDGRISAGGRWVVPEIPAPLVSISHCPDAVVAVAAGEELGGVGIDVENRGRLNEDVIAAGFTAAEQRRLSELPTSARRDAALNFWCAKEAASKALGVGFSAGANSLVVNAPIPFDGEEFSVSPSTPPAGSDAAAADVHVVSRIDGELAIALACLFPEPCRPVEARS